MASKLVMDAVSARLAASWTDCQVFGVNGSEGDPPTDGTAFLSVQYPVANETHIAMGSVGQRTFREDGAIRFVLNVARGLGISQGAGWADDLRTLFRAGQFGGINCLGASPSASDNSNDNGNYYQFRVVVLYYADVLA